MVDVILGLQWGDEGKGKIVDCLAPNYDVVCRFQGGPNAGHTLVIGDDKHVLHTVPSGIFRENMINVIGNGVVLDPIVFINELEQLDKTGLEYRSRLILSKKLHLILPTHRMLDAASESAKGRLKIGSTLKGIGPAYMDKTGRNGLRLGDILHDSFKTRYDLLKEKHIGLLGLYPSIDFDLRSEEQKWFDAINELKSLQIRDCEYLVNKYIRDGKKILAEGAQGSMLDIDFGTYPYVTSSNTITAGVCSGLGIAPQAIKEVIGVTKAYATRVGSGPFPTELFDEVGQRLQIEGHEFGATTGRPRRCGWLDIPQVKYTCMLSGVTQLVLTKIDVLNTFEELSLATDYAINGVVSSDIPYDLEQYSIEPVLKKYKGWNTDLTKISSIGDSIEATQYITDIEKILATKVSMISYGPKRSEICSWNYAI